MIPPSILVWIFVVTGLLIAVVIVGQVQHNLAEVTPLAIGLSGVLSGVIGSALLRVHKRDDEQQ